MTANISPFPINGNIIAPPSKSIAMRYILLAALCSGETIIENTGNSKDVQTAIKCINALGAKIERRGNSLIINGATEYPDTAEFDFGECGFLLRSVLPVAHALGIGFRYTMGGNLPNRPLKPLFDCLKSTLSENNGVYCGKMVAGEYMVDGTVSSQFVSGLLIAAAAIDGETTIKISGENVSVGYIDMTVSALAVFGVKTERISDGIKVFGGHISAPVKLKVEGDYSSAAYFLILGALGDGITVKGLNPYSEQPDKAIIDILKEYGASVGFLSDGVTVSGGAIRNPLSVNIRNCPDLAPIIAIAAAYAYGVSVIGGTDRLKIKESDRLNGIVDLLNSSGVSCEKGDNEIIVRGGNPKGIIYTGDKDHRMVMAAAILATAADGKSRIYGAESVAKSYPAFFDDLCKVGGLNHVRISR